VEATKTANAIETQTATKRVRGKAVTLDQVRPSGLTKIYCKCGSIVGLDRDMVATKKKLNKPVECTACRNMRISHDIDELNGELEIAEIY